MTKQELIHQISQQTGIDSTTSRSIVEAFFEVVKESLTKGESIYVRGFGTFQPKQRAAKVGRNIGQNTALSVAAHVVPFFKPSREFSDQIKHKK
jgi:DNA-binding protein HU-beta